MKQARCTGGPWRRCSDTRWRGAECDYKQETHVKPDINGNFHVDETEWKESPLGAAREGRSKHERWDDPERYTPTDGNVVRAGHVHRESAKRHRSSLHSDRAEWAMVLGDKQLEARKRP